MPEPRSAAQDAIHREMYERSRDIIRVFNPLSTDYKFKFDSVWYKIPSKGYKDWERYLALHYFENIKHYIISSMVTETGEKMIEERRRRGLDEMFDKYQENRLIWDKAWSVNNKELQENIAKEIIIGLIEKFGQEPGPEDAYAKADPINNPLNKTPDELLFEKLSNNSVENVTIDTPSADLSKPVIPMNPPASDVAPIKTVKGKRLAKEATVETA